MYGFSVALLCILCLGFHIPSFFFFLTHKHAISFLFFLVFLGPHPQHVDVPRLGVELELQLPAYIAAMATPDLS